MLAGQRRNPKRAGVRAEFPPTRPRCGPWSTVFCWALAVAGGTPSCAPDNVVLAAARDDAGPCALAVSPDGRRLYVAEAQGDRVDVVALPRNVVVRSVPLPGAPTGLALDRSGRVLYVTCLGPPASVCAVDTQTGNIAFRWPTGSAPCAPVLGPADRALYVCDRYQNCVRVFDTRDRVETARMPAVREPCAAALDRERGRLYVANHLPATRSDESPVSAALTIIDTAAATARNLPLPDGSTGVRDVGMSSDGRLVFVAHVLARYGLPTARVDQGWMNANALTMLDAAAETLIATVLLDEPERGAANPWALAVAERPQVLCVALAGTHELALVDVPSLLKKLEERRVRAPADPAVASSGSSLYAFAPQPDLPPEVIRLNVELANPEVANDLGFLSGVRRRVSLSGKAPRSVAVAGSRVYVAQYFTDDLAVAELKADRTAEIVGTIPLGPRRTPSPRRRGEMLFHDATLCRQQWQSCASCHPDARADGLNWDLLNDGLNTPKNTKSLLLAHATPPAMWSGVRETAEDAVRSGVRHIQFADIGEQDAVAIDAYLRALRPAASPVGHDEGLRRQVERGKQVFARADVGCAACHPAPLFTDRRSHDVGSEGPFDRRREFDTPSLVECWRTAPYLHDGRFTSVEALLIDGKHGLSSAAAPRLSDQELRDLAVFVRSL